MPRPPSTLIRRSQHRRCATLVGHSPEAKYLAVILPTLHPTQMQSTYISSTPAKQNSTQRQFREGSAKETGNFAAAVSVLRHAVQRRCRGMSMSQGAQTLHNPFLGTMFGRDMGFNYIRAGDNLVPSLQYTLIILILMFYCKYLQRVTYV